MVGLMWNPKVSNKVADDMKVTAWSLAQPWA